MFWNKRPSRVPQVKSLRRRVVVWLLPPLIILMIINAYLSYRGALAVVNRAYDRSLQASLKAIAENTHSYDGHIVVNIPYSALELFEDGTDEHVFYAVRAPDGRTITGYSDLKIPDSSSLAPLIVTDSVYRGEVIRMGVMHKRLYDAALGDHDAVTILMAETTESRAALTRELFYDSLRRQALLIVAGLVALALALSTAFKPLIAIRDAIRKRDDDDLTAIPRDQVPAEINPLIDAMNHQMERLDKLVEARKRFIADAAHQLRTPLAVLNTQVDYGLRATDPHEMRNTFVALLAGLRNARHLTDQMLALSRAEAAHGLGQSKTTLDMATLVRSVAFDLLPLALDKQVDLGYEGDDAGAMVLGSAGMLREMMTNLIDNAIRYTPSGGTVTASVKSDHAGWVTVLVTDSGPGIPLDERANVLKRFYRILGIDHQHGSGLGLAIVNEICLAHDGQLRLDDGPQGHGLEVSITLPLQRI